MSFIRSLVSFVLSILFVTLLFATISSYTIGSLLEKENVKDFIMTDIAPQLIQDRCKEFCAENGESCVRECIAQTSNMSSSTIDTAVNEMYEREVLGISLNSMSNISSNFLLFLVLTLASGTMIYIISENPLDSLGKDFISASVSLFIAGFSPELLLGSSVSGVSVISDMFEYLSQGLEIQIKIGIALLVLGIALIALDKYKENKR